MQAGLFVAVFLSYHVYKPNCGRVIFLLSKPVHWLMCAIIASLSVHQFVVLMTRYTSRFIVVLAAVFWSCQLLVLLVCSTPIWGRIVALHSKPVYWLTSMCAFIATLSCNSLAVLAACYHSLFAGYCSEYGSLTSSLWTRALFQYCSYTFWLCLCGHAVVSVALFLLLHILLAFGLLILSCMCCL